LIAICAVVGIAASAATLFAQEASTVSLSNGIELRVSVNLGPQTGQQTAKVEMAPASGNSVYRIFRDQNGMAVFAYELAVARSADGQQILLTTKPVEDEFAARFPNSDGGKPVPTMSSESQLEPLTSGRRVDIGLFELQGMGLKVVDSAQVRLFRGSGATSDIASSVLNRLRFLNLKVMINRTPASSAFSAGGAAGRFAMFFIPGRGGYFFSAEAVPDRAVFTKAGSIDGNHFTFTIDNDIYECTAAASILSQGGTGELWVYHDPGYQPAGNWTQEIPPPAGVQPGTQGFFTAASDTLSWWLR